MTFRVRFARCRVVTTVVVFVAWLAVVLRASAGEGSYAGIAAATSDGKHAAMFFISHGMPCNPGALVKTADDMRGAWSLERVVEINTCDGWERVRPFARWKWHEQPAEARALHAFADLYDDKSAGKRARVAYDGDTELYRLEISQDDRWWPVKALPGFPPKLTGTLLLPGRYLIRIHRSENISDWDEVFAFSEAEVPDVRKRFDQARAEAIVLTRKLRELRSKGERPFNPPPKKKSNRDYWERAKMIDPAIERWAFAAAYGSLEAKDLVDMIWLLAVRDAPGKKLEALRMSMGLRERERKAFDSLLAALETDADTAGLLPLLATGFEPFRKLPVPHFGHLSEADFRPLSDAELGWMHRLIWAWAGFRFSDPQIASHVALFPWYRPIREQEWRKLLADPFFQKDHDRSVLVVHSPTLKALKNVEKERGLRAPPL